jgi:hypothetical protein
VGLKLTSHLHLVLRLRMHGVIPPVPHRDNYALYDIGLGAFAASELDKVFSGYQPR